jgi:hypothetical protein
MAKDKNMTSNEEKLISVVEISRKFLRSIQIDDDFGREDALSGYVCQGTARSLLESMAQQVLETKQRAFTWTGPYGGGKSSLALMLCSLVGPNQKLRDRAKKILALPSDSKIYKAFESKGEGWIVLPVVGKRSSVQDQIFAAISKRTSKTTSKKNNTDSISALVKLAESSKQGVLLIIDELGKFLENAAIDSTEDIYFFQQLAEAASRTNGNLVVVGILHQPFEAYASSLGRQTRDDWSKIQGRFIDIPLVSATDEVIELIGQSINRNKKIDLNSAESACRIVADNIKKRRPAAPSNLAQSLLSCWPLHPALTSLLGPISRRKFGQNERSIFGFLASREPLGFYEFLQTQSISINSMYRPANYWDYLRANSEPAILASPDGHRWAQSVDSVERAEAKGTPIHVEVAKTVALIEMFRSGAALAADLETITVSVNVNDQEIVKQILDDLISWKILIERKHLNAYSVFAGSDFDIEGAINITRNEISSFNGKLISELTDLNPVIAKRLYHDTGTMRWFSKTIVPLGDLRMFLSSYVPTPGSVGAFILCVPDTQISDKIFLSTIQELSLLELENPVILGVAKNGKQVTDLSHELAATERVFSSRTELEGDTVARRELASRISSLRSTLQEELADAFRFATWYERGERKNDENNKTISAIASTVAERIFHSTPLIKSELINRDELSSNIVKARRELMYRMLKNSSVSKLGYEGFPADAGLYYTVLNTPGIHMNRGRLGWGFVKPRDDGSIGSSYLELWSQIEIIFKNADEKIGLDEVYAVWQVAPYGLKKGVMPIIALAFFLANKAHIAIYFDNVFTPNINEVIIDELLNDPKLIKFKYVSAGENKSSLAQSIAINVLPSYQLDTYGTKISPLDTARGLVSIVMNLPNWTKRTNSVSESAQEVRTMLLKASDPNKVLFADLPTILGSSSEDDLVEKLTEVITELKVAYPLKLKNILQIVLEALQHSSDSILELKERARSVKGITGNFQLDSFATRIEEFDGSDSSIESLISNAIHTPSHSWVDRDLDAAIIQLGNLSLEFRKAEALSSLRGRESTRKVFNLVLSAGQGNDLNKTVEISKTDQTEIDAAIKQILPILENIDSRLVYAALADLGIKFSQKREKVIT